MVDFAKIQELRTRLTKNAEEKYDNNLWMAKAGRNVIRILPGIEGGAFYLEIGKHWMPSLQREKNIPVLCTQVTQGTPCGICALIQELKTANEPLAQKFASKLSAGRSFLVNLIDRDQGNAVMPGEIKTTAFNDVLSFLLDPDYGDVTDPLAGFDIIVEKTGKGMLTKYSARAVRNPSKIETTFTLQDLTTVWNPPTAEVIQTHIEAAKDVLAHILTTGEGDVPMYPQTQSQGYVPQQQAYNNQVPQQQAYNNQVPQQQAYNNQVPQQQGYKPQTPSQGREYTQAVQRQVSFPVASQPQNAPPVATTLREKMAQLTQGRTAR